MPRTAWRFFWFFAALAVAALGLDIYIWQTSNDHPFALADLGYVVKHLTPAAYDAVVTFLGADLFNLLLTPLLMWPGVAIFGTLAALSLGVGWLQKRRYQAKTGMRPDHFRYRR